MRHRDPHAARRRVAEQRALGGEDDVARADQVEPAGQAVAVGLGDDRLAEVPHPQPALDHLAQRLAVAGDRRLAEVGHRVALLASGRRRRPPYESTGREVVAGAERPPGAAQADDAHVVAGVELAQGRVQVVEQPGAHRVELLGAVEGDRGDGPVDRRRSGSRNSVMERPLRSSGAIGNVDRVLGEGCRSMPSSVSWCSVARTVRPSMSRKPSVPSWVLRLCGYVGEPGLTHSVGPMRSMRSTWLSPYTITSMSWVPKRRCFQRSTVSSAASPASARRGSARRARRRGRATTSSAGGRRRRRSGAPPSRPRRCRAPTTAAPARRAGRARRDRGCRRRGGSRRRPAKTSNTCGHSSGRASGMWVSEINPMCNDGPFRQLGRSQRQWSTVRRVGVAGGTHTGSLHGGRCAVRTGARPPSYPRRRPGRPARASRRPGRSATTRSAHP